MQTARLTLKLYEEKDKENFIRFSTDKTIMKYVDFGALTDEQAENLWRKLADRFYPQGINTIWAVFAKEDARYIGHAAIRPRPQKREDWEISYMLLPKEWNKGFATEIAHELINYGFGELNLTEIFATVKPVNKKSIHVLEKTGMSFLYFEFDEDKKISVYSIKK